MTQTEEQMQQARHRVQKHLESEHHTISPFSTYIKEIVYGANDGIVTTFAVVAGFAGASGGEHMIGISVVAVLLFGLANLFADAASMGLGEFLSLRSSKDVYQSEKTKELTEIRKNPQDEKKETKDILVAEGFNEKDAETLTDIYSKNEQYWLRFMMNEELELPNIENENPALTGMATFFAFVGFGSIPLIPYVFWSHAIYVFQYSIVATVLALVIVGCMRWYVTSQKIVRSVGETVLIGGLAAVIAFTVGTFFR